MCLPFHVALSHVKIFSRKILTVKRSLKLDKKYVKCRKLPKVLHSFQGISVFFFCAQR